MLSRASSTPRSRPRRPRSAAARSPGSRRGSRKELKDYLALIEQTKELEIENLKERHALQSSDRERKYEEERETNIRDHHKAERIRAELEAKRIHEEIEKNNLRDGPPPPRRGK